jgi:hypothetical protein
MSLSIALSLLNRASNGDELLQILDALASESDDSVEENVEF